MTAPSDQGPGSSVQELIGSDTGPPVSPPLRERSVPGEVPVTIRYDAYTRQEECDLELERLWYRTWLCVGRDEDLPKVGDSIVYEIGERSVVLVRSEPDVVRAFPNSCLHRGRQLRDCDGNSRRITCPFHGWSWELDGTLAYLPAEWDHPGLNVADLSLPEVRVERWEGFVFVNLDPDASVESFHRSLDVVREHLPWFKLDRRFTAVHVSKVMPANWKAALEAFMESYHVEMTHPHLLTWTGDTNSQYDVWDRCSRMITPSGTSSPQISDIDPATVFAAACKGLGAGAIPFPEGAQPRPAIAGIMRTYLDALLGFDASEVSDSELIDGIQYFVFPNWFPWGGIGIGLHYLFRPYLRDPDRCIMDIRMLMPVPPAGDRPPAARRRVLTEDQPFASVLELGALGQVFDEDLANMAALQKGMKSSVVEGPNLARTQESRIRHFHALLQTELASDDTAGS